MHGLDEIPWHTLHHAYGTAEDVPQLLRQLQTAEPDADNEDSPLWHLYGNIWHQGTVYEATSHAVPFLIQLVEVPRAGRKPLVHHRHHRLSHRYHSQG